MIHRGTKKNETKKEDTNHFTWVEQKAQITNILSAEFIWIFSVFLLHAILGPDIWKENVDAGLQSNLFKYLFI